MAHDNLTVGNSKTDAKTLTEDVYLVNYWHGERQDSGYKPFARKSPELADVGVMASDAYALQKSAAKNKLLLLPRFCCLEDSANIEMAWEKIRHVTVHRSRHLGE
jgi:hypothetical protein